MSTPSKGLFQPDLDAGVIVDGRYEIIEELGRGGMGTVYEARQIKLHKGVALKVLQADRAQRDDGGASLKRFLREARAASSIKHRNVVDIIDFGDLEDGSTYYVMELLEGRDLSTLLKSEGPMPWPRLRLLLRQVLGALLVAHDKGIIHRDIKPANVMLLDTPDEWGGEWVKVLDFGIAKVQETDEESQALTGTSELLGTAAYMAPELVRGDGPDARADLYAVGIMAYQLLTGRVPFSGVNTFQVLLQQTSDPPRPPRMLVPNLPEPVEAFVLRALAKDPRARFQSAAEMIEAIDVLGDTPRGELSISSGPIALAEGADAEGFGPRASGPQPAALPATQRYTIDSVPAPSVGQTLRDPDLGSDSATPTPIPTTPIPTAPSSTAPTPTAAGRGRAVMAVLLLVVAALAGLVAWLALRSPAEPPQVAVPSPPDPGDSALASDPVLGTTPVDPPGTTGEPAATDPPAADTGRAAVAGSGSGPGPDSDSGSGSGSGPEADADSTGEPTPASSGPSRPGQCQTLACRQRRAERQLQRVVKRRCRALGEGTVVTVKLTIGTDGRVLMPRVLAPHSQTPLGRCVLDAVATGRFPPPERLTPKELKFKP